MATIKIELDDDGCVEVAYNAKHGGFSLSNAALMRMIDLESKEAKECYDRFLKSGLDKTALNHSHYPNISRIDPILVRVIKELGAKANGQCARLAIAKVRLDDLIDINEYDGYERVKRSVSEKVYGDDDE